MPNWKAKGSNAERELIKRLHEESWSAVRMAGSGSTRFPSPDILAGNGHRRIAVECKVTKDKKKYFTKEEIEQLKTFATNFGAESWVGIRFAGEDWLFFMLEDLEKTNCSFVATLDMAAMKGLTLTELLKNSE
ncbi:MAG: Holliday junction resolvase Hjc [archaeon]